MPKNKKHKTKKSSKLEKSIRNKKITQKVYTDSFLKSEITLAPSAFEVYNQKIEKNEIVLRSNQELELGDEISVIPGVVVNEIDKKDINKEYHQKIGEVIGNLENTSKDSTLQDIITKIQQEKEEFDSSVEKNLNREDQPNVVDDKTAQKETLFDKIYAREFLNSSQPSSVLKSIINIFTSDIVWQAVAVSMLIGVILFYFQGLQPTLLRSYTLKAKKQVQDLSDRYSEQVKDYFISQNLVLGRFTYEPQLLCSQLTTYDQSQSDIDNLSRLRIGLFADPKLKTIDNRTNFYDSQVNSEYNSLYGTYSMRIQNYQTKGEELLAYAKFLEYKNTWIKACGVIEQNTGNLAKIQEACSTIVSADETFKEEKSKIPFWDKIDSSVASGISLCQTVNASNLKLFVKNWFVSFDQISQIRPDFEEQNTNLISINEQFTNVDVKITTDNINKILLTKTSLVGQWYFLSFNF